MSGRIYPEGDLDDKRKSRYCPECYSNNLTSEYGGFTLFSAYVCMDCSISFPIYKSLTKATVREFKLKELLT